MVIILTGVRSAKAWSLPKMRFLLLSHAMPFKTSIPYKVMQSQVNLPKIKNKNKLCTSRLIKMLTLYPAATSRSLQERKKEMEKLKAINKQNDKNKLLNPG